MNLTRLLDAESEALSLTDVKNHLRISDNNDDDALRLFIAAIRKKTETYIGQSLVTSTWEYKLDCFSDEIELPMEPIQSITFVQFVDTDKVLSQIAPITYQFDKKGRLKPTSGYEWPATYDQYDAVTIEYIAGQTHAGNVEQDIKLAMLLWIGACEINRENNLIGTVISEIPNSAKDLLNPYRKWKL